MFPRPMHHYTAIRLANSTNLTCLFTFTIYYGLLVYLLVLLTATYLKFLCYYCYQYHLLTYLHITDLPRRTKTKTKQLKLISFSLLSHSSPAATPVAKTP